ncbi:MAG: M14 family murein peptide amidase A [Gammaproteobacteria bacterium]
MKKTYLYKAVIFSALTVFFFTTGNSQAENPDGWRHWDGAAYPASVTNNIDTHILAETIDTAEIIQTECKRIEGKLASVVPNECQERDLVMNDGVSVNGASILYKEYPPLPNRNPLGRVLLLGGIHGDEYSSVTIVFKWMKTLDQYHSGLFHWRIVPLLNPDGLLRKKSQRMNANGVDLNRNFPMPDWEAETTHYWLNRTHRDPRRYPGKSALSEPETHWLAKEIEQFEPDVIVAVHAPHGVVDYDGPKDGPYRLGRLYLSLIGTYPGSLGNYAGVQKNIPVVTIELPYAGIMPKPKEVNDIWRDLVRWLRNHLPTEVRSAENIQETEPS